MKPTRLLDGATYVPADKTDIRKTITSTMQARKAYEDGLGMICGLQMRHFILCLLRSLPAAQNAGNYVFDAFMRGEWPQGVTTVEHLRETVTASAEMAKALMGPGKHIIDVMRLPTLPDDVKKLLEMELSVFSLTLRARFNCDMVGPIVIGSTRRLTESEALALCNKTDWQGAKRHIPTVIGNVKIVRL